MPSIFSALYGSLSKHYMHKKWKFKAMAEWIGLKIKKVPKFLRIHFRVIHGCCEWLESQDRGVYVYYVYIKKMKKGVLTKRYEQSEIEMMSEFKPLKTLMTLP